MSDKHDENQYFPVGDRVSIFLRGGVWQANWQEGGKQRRKSLKTKNKREAAIRAQRLEAEQGQSGAEAAPIVEATITDVVAAFIAKHVAENKAAKTLMKYREIGREIEALALERRVTHVSELDFQFADAYRAAQRAIGNGDRTIHGKLETLHSITLFAVSRKMVAADPLDDYPLKKPKPTPQPCWSWEEATTILTASPSTYRDLFEFLRLTGCRIGEAQFLTWSDVDFQKGLIHIRPKDGWKPKTGDQRKVKVPGRLLDLLRTRPREGRWVFTAPVSSRYPTKGRQVSERRALGALKRVLKKLALEGKLHTFRHTYISHLLMEGTPVPVVRKQVGHVDQDTIDLYTHVREENVTDFVMNL